MSSPHVFVVSGNLAHLACDAVVISTDAALKIEESWGELANPRPARPSGFADDGVRAFAGAPLAHDSRVRVYANVGGAPGTDLQWFVEGGVEAVRCAAAEVERRSVSAAKVGAASLSASRIRPLIGVPLFGSRKGGGEARTGELVAALMPALRKAAEECEVDLAVVVRSTGTYAAVQSHRRARLQTDFDVHLSGTLRKVGDTLAQQALTGNLVLFIGAGASRGGGLPSWDGLLRTLAHEAELTDDELREFEDLDELDRGRLVQLRFQESKKSLGTTIARLFKTHARVPLTQALLASLPVDQVATTNYDQLFEQASTDAKHACGVLPYAPNPKERRWLLKLHGCVTRPDQIVLTRDDYLRFASTRSALAGIVQALMLTRHMLFVGFSLNDDNFHRIVHDVRSTLATSMEVRPHFGTALSLEGKSLKRQLWERDVDIVSLDDQAGADSARRLRILLDYIGMQAADCTAHLLSARYDGVLSDDDKQLRLGLVTLVSSLPRDRSSGAWSTAGGRRLARFLADLGDDGTSAMASTRPPG